MKNHLLVLLALVVCCRSSSAQRITYTEGDTFSLEDKDANFDFLGEVRGDLVFMQNGTSPEQKALCLVDPRTLKIIYKRTFESLRIFHESDFFGFYGDTILLFKTIVRSREGVLTRSLVAHIIEVDDGFRDLDERLVDTFMGDNEPMIDFDSHRDTFAIYTSTRTSLYDRNLNKLAYVPKHIVFAPKAIRYKNNEQYGWYGRNAWFEIKDRDWGKAFYKIGAWKGERIYAQSEFVRDSNSFQMRGHYSLVQVLKYHERKSKRRGDYTFTPKEGIRILNYNCMLMEGGAILIFGVYQDMSAQDENVRLGVFSKILDADLNEVTEANYLEVINAPYEQVKSDVNYDLLADKMSMGSFEKLDIYSRTDFLLTRRFSYHTYLLCINRHSGQITCEGLYRKYARGRNSHMLNNLCLIKLDDTSELMLFYDHPDNMNTTISDTSVKQAGWDSGQYVLTYVTFTPSQGFSRRQMVSDKLLSRYFMNLYFKENYNYRDPRTGNYEIVGVAYNRGNTGGRYVRIVISSLRVSLQD